MTAAAFDYADQPDKGQRDASNCDRVRVYTFHYNCSGRRGEGHRLALNAMTLMGRLPALARWAQTGFGLLERRHRRDQRVGDGLPGWACRIRTAESARELSH
jgi:hypothetical protein